MTDWIRWDGGERPVPMSTLVEVRYRNSVLSPIRTARHRMALQWDHEGRHDDIVAYRVITEETSPNAHYRQGEIECIDAIRAALTDEEWRGFCKGNVLKYVWREKHKGGNDTLVKAQDYLRWTIAGKAEGKR